MNFLKTIEDVVTGVKKPSVNVNTEVDVSPNTQKLLMFGLVAVALIVLLAKKK